MSMGGIMGIIIGCIIMLFLVIALFWQVYYKCFEIKDEKVNNLENEKFKKSCIQAEDILKKDNRYINSVHQIINDPEKFDQALKDGVITVGEAIDKNQLELIKKTEDKHNLKIQTFKG